MHARRIVCIWAGVWACAAASLATHAQEPVQSLSKGPSTATGAGGDARRGEAIVRDRSVGMCLLCHSGPFPDERSQGNLAPPLDGAGARHSREDLRARIEDGRRFNPGTIMPAYARTGGFARVGAAWDNKPILEAAQIEDVVAFLETLR
jgi:sulfur-oxidizing protein SoxX